MTIRTYIKGTSVSSTAFAMYEPILFNKWKLNAEFYRNEEWSLCKALWTGIRGEVETLEETESLLIKHSKRRT